MSSRPASSRTAGSSAAAPPTTPFAPGSENAWTEILQLNKQEAKAKGDVGRPDSVLFVLGATGSGKTTLLRRILYGGSDSSTGNTANSSSQTPKPGEGMEYHYARKSRPTDSNRRDIAHVFEMSGSKTFADEITEKENVFFGARQVTTATALICIDLSKPAETVPTLEYWLSKIKQATEKTFTKLESRGSRLPEQLRNRHKKQFNRYHSSSDKDNEHADLKSGSITVKNFSGVQIVIAATKQDAHVKYDAEPRKALAKALRYLAHTNGASLFYIGGLKGFSTEPGINTDNATVQLSKIRAFVNHAVFTGADKPFPKKLECEFDHLKNVLAVNGFDSLESIGQPKGSSGEKLIGTSNEDMSQIWRELCFKMFPANGAGMGQDLSWLTSGDDASKENFSDQTKKQKESKYAEPEVDVVAALKREELEGFMKQQLIYVKK